jgi:predicted GIY-YIG superfamily endonuclease
MHYVYVLRSSADNGFYIGYSANLQKRFAQHVGVILLRLPIVVLGN